MTGRTVNEASISIGIVGGKKRTMTDHGESIGIIIDEMTIESIEDGRKVRMNDGIEKRAGKSDVLIGSMAGIRITVRRDDETGIGIMREIGMVRAVGRIEIVRQDTIAASGIREMTALEESTEKGGIEAVDFLVLTIKGEHVINNLHIAYTHQYILCFRHHDKFHCSKISGLEI